MLFRSTATTEIYTTANTLSLHDALPIAGATVTMLAPWSADGFRDMVRRTRMTANFMVPTQAIQIVQDPKFDPDAYRSWRKVSFAGAPMPDWTQKALMEKLPHLRLTQIYGQSEMGVIAVNRWWNLPAKLGSVGREAYNVDLRVVRPDGTPVKEPFSWPKIGRASCRERVFAVV